jgi:two-component system sensor histidine kinase/response regulator
MTDNDIKILLVDDEEKNVSRLSEILSEEGYSIDTAQNGDAALKKLNNSHYDIVVTDLDMPGKTGYDIVKHISGSHTETLALVITDHASFNGAIRAIKLGAYDFIYKPIDATSLKHAIKRASEKILLQRENLKNLKELEQLNELKNEFLSVVSHDLRSPLATIGGYVNYLLKNGELSEIQGKHLLTIRDISNNLYSLVNELLDISKIEAGVMEINKEKADITEIINVSINNLIILAIDKNNTIEFFDELDNPIVFIDRVKILQVINNLISNAIKFTESGTITVRASEEDSNIIISVEDSGVGITRKDLKGLFDRYSYFHKEGTRGEIGTGLGLAICKRFIELHGGEIRAQSKVGKGSIFQFNIPKE